MCKGLCSWCNDGIIKEVNRNHRCKEHEEHYQKVSLPKKKCKKMNKREDTHFCTGIWTSFSPMPNLPQK